MTYSVDTANNTANGRRPATAPRLLTPMMKSSPHASQLYGMGGGPGGHCCLRRLSPGIRAGDGRPPWGTINPRRRQNKKELTRALSCARRLYCHVVVDGPLRRAFFRRRLDGTGRHNRTLTAVHIRNSTNMPKMR